jgi:Zn-dependent peptidase ImmA (M78 family)
MALRADVNPALLAWARERSGLPADHLYERFPHLVEWERGSLAPTLRQLERFAGATHTPIGFLFLDEPPDERIPIRDYRTRGDAGVQRPSADLLDTIFQCQRRQDWFREFAEAEREDTIPFVGSLTTRAPVVDAATSMRTELRFDISERGSNWTEALKRLADHAEDSGVLVMFNSVVANDTHRRLNPDEFGGFALADNLAPLVFVNAADTKAAQIFTLAHELAHLWLGESALSEVTVRTTPNVSVERWCNRVAAEFLVPLDQVEARFNPNAALTQELDRLARVFKTSTLVVLRRARDAGHIDPERYPELYADELARVRQILKERGDDDEDADDARKGNFFNTLPRRVSRRFARALVMSTIEGNTSHREALRMLGFRQLSTFERFARELGVT